MRNTKNKVVAFVLTFILAFSQVACGPEKVEKSIGTFTRAVKSARQITTVQNQFGHLSDADYLTRLKLFKSVYVSIDTLGDKLVSFGEINDTNRGAVLDLLKDVNTGVVHLINTGHFGVKNDKSKAEFTRWLLVASAALSSIQIAVAAAKKPIPTATLKIESAESAQ